MFFRRHALFWISEMCQLEIFFLIFRILYVLIFYVAPYWLGKHSIYYQFFFLVLANLQFGLNLDNTQSPLLSRTIRTFVMLSTLLVSVSHFSCCCFFLIRGTPE